MSSNGHGLDVVGPAEVAAMIGVKKATVHQANARGRMPAPDLIVSRVPIWTRERIVAWAHDTGRRIVDEDPLVDQKD